MRLASLWEELLRRNPEDPYAWAMVHRRRGGRPFIDLPALRDVARDESALVVVQKSAQVGLTELMVSKALWATDTGYGPRQRPLRHADTEPDGRLRAVAVRPRDPGQRVPSSPATAGTACPQRRRQQAPEAHRPGYIYLRGADSRRQIAGVDADLVLLDEFDQMAAGTLELAQKRLASSGRGQLIVASTPRLAEAGINGAVPAVRTSAVTT